MTDINSITTYQNAVAALQASISDAIITNYNKGVNDGKREIFGRQPWREIDDQKKLIVQHEEKIRMSLFKICEQDALIGRQDEKIKSLMRLADQQVSSKALRYEVETARVQMTLQSAELSRVNGLLNLRNAEIDRLKNDARMTACEQVSAKALRQEIDRQSAEIARLAALRANMNMAWPEC